MFTGTRVKSIIKAGSIVLCCLLLLGLWAAPAEANRSLDMQQVTQELTLYPDASVKVTEHLTIDFQGGWEGFFINVPQNFGTRVTEVSVWEDGRPYQYHPGPDYGPPGTYLVREQGDSVLIDWSLQAQNETRTFMVSYRVLNVVRVHNDIAEFYRKFISEENGLRIGQVRIHLTLPPGAENQVQGTDILIFGHGPLEGEVQFAGPGEVAWEVQPLPPYTFLEGRVLMPPGLFPQAPPELYSGQDARASILAQEAQWAREADRKRLLARLEIGLAILAVLGSMVLVYIMWLRSGRKFPTQFQGDYYRDLPATYSPAELGVLWNFGPPRARDITATLLDLARRKVLFIQEETVDKKGLFRSGEIKLYRMILKRRDLLTAGDKSEEGTLQLRTHEKSLLDFIFTHISQGKDEVYLHEFEKWTKDNSLQFHKFWSTWKKSLEGRGQQLVFFDHQAARYKKIGLVAGVVLFIIASVMLANNIMVILGAGIAFGAVIIAVIPLAFKRRSPSGQEDMAKWEAFRRFLLHFSQMERYEIPSLIIWEHYLVYATTLGVAKEVIKQLQLVFPNMQEGDYRFGTGWFAGYALADSSFLNITDSFDRAISSAEKAYKAATSRSSSSGGGGGFSGGGGGGSGGSSYGGR